MAIKIKENTFEYLVKAISDYKTEDSINKEFNLTFLIAEDLSTESHKYVYGVRSNGLQCWSNGFRNGKKKIKENKKGKYIEFSNEPMFKKVRVYL
jgi:hypothetical protein